MTVWLLPLTAIVPQTSWDLLILPLYTHNLPLAGGIEPPTKGPHSPPPQAAGQPERFSRNPEQIHIGVHEKARGNDHLDRAFRLAFA
jgi:hypothetical protein